MLEYKKYLDYPIYGHCIELECNNKEFLDECNDTLKEADYYYDKIADALMVNEMQGTFMYEAKGLIKWHVIVFVIKTEWVDEYDRGEEINGVSSSLSTAKYIFDNIIEKDQRENEIHKKAIELDNQGKKSGYIIERSDDTYSLFEEGDYNNYHFNVGIYKQYLK